jgi:hypothetical protein
MENGSAFVESMMKAKTLTSTIQIRSEYAKTAQAEFIAFLTKIGVYRGLGKGVF